MVVVHCLSKSTHFLALLHPYSTKTVADKFIGGIIKLHGMPKSIISDLDPIFISRFLKEFFKLFNTNCSLAPPTIHKSTTKPKSLTALSRKISPLLCSPMATKVVQLLSMGGGILVQYYLPYFIRMMPFQALYGRTSPTIPN